VGLVSVRIPKDYVVYSFSSKYIPKYRAYPGDVVVFETVDALGGQVVDETTPLEAIDWSKVNPATGPLYVEGAKPGDTLVVEVEDIRVADRAVIVAVPGFGALHDKKFSAVARVMEITGGKLIFRGVEVELRPMIGVIGVAPEEGE